MCVLAVIVYPRCSGAVDNFAFGQHTQIDNDVLKVSGQNEQTHKQTKHVRVCGILDDSNPFLDRCVCVCVRAQVQM